MTYLQFYAIVVFIGSAFSFGGNREMDVEKPVAVAWYHFSHVRDTMHPARLWKEDFLLAFDATRSVYASDTRLAQDSANRVKLEVAMAAGTDEVNIGMLAPVTHENIYTRVDAMYLHRRLMGSQFIIREALEKTDWKIENETKQILGYTCQKATGICKGRQYIAWFTTDIAAAFGPWKLQGLPGLILEARDPAGRIRFTCTKVVLNAALPYKLSLDYPADANLATTTEFARLQQAQIDNFAIGNAGNGDVIVERTTVNGSVIGAPSRKAPVNYPLELIR